MLQATLLTWANKVQNGAKQEHRIVHFGEGLLNTQIDVLQNGD